MLDYLAPNYSGRLLYLNDFNLSVHGEKKWRFISRYIILVDDRLWSQTLSKTTVVVPCLLDNTVQFWKGKTAQSKSLTNIRTPTKHSDMCQSCTRLQKDFKRRVAKTFLLASKTWKIHNLLLHTPHTASYLQHWHQVGELISCILSIRLRAFLHTHFVAGIIFDMRRKKNNAPICYIISKILLK
jgi:hypothetical protein